jgi:AcrR family transcriptional regulator
MSRSIFEKADAIPLVAEVFRELGYEGASLSRITERTGLGKGSLYHFFPGGKEDMATHILAHIDAWFVENVFLPLESEEPRAAIARMWCAVDEYFRSGRRICLLGAFALDRTRDQFSKEIRGYFLRWIASLRHALVRDGVEAHRAAELAEHAVLGIQGALVLARATRDERLFSRALKRLALDLGRGGDTSARSTPRAGH